MNIAICDDNPVIARKVGSLVEDYAESKGFLISYDIFNSYESVEGKLSQYDIFILDYNMNDYEGDDDSTKCNGMDFAKQIRRHADPDKCIIFMTSYPDFIYESFQVRTHRFILKPVTQENLFEALDNFIVDNSVANKLVVKSKKDTYILLTNEILYIDSIKKDTFIHLKNNVIKCHKRLTEFEKELDELGFLRVHRSYLVNVSKIDSFNYKEATMINGDVVSISDTKYSKLCRMYCE